MCKKGKETMTHIEDVMIEELESVFKCDEHTEDELLEKYDDLYKRVNRILKVKL
tara:strand:- start:1057 stop:1218 length:162 start_codon:yes stop_codon:yes gene_type:complete